ncbi:HK97 gp10 family phage protein [Corynebacterium striatum]|uniref:HK97 gp10 family phage protein n=1 Tax=Corynebacterium striatum TaxID=43770 RepID=UPI0027B9150C|nr:HK97 gp10 family phage protein [Corynebacterium striatum]
MADLDWRGEQVADSIHDALVIGVRAGAELVLDEARERAPKDKEFLRNDSKVTQDDTTAVVAFGHGPAKAYAARQHEEVGWKHHDGEAKYLENAALNKRDEVLKKIADEVRKAL